MLAKHIVEELTQALSDEEVVDKIASVWGKYVDRVIGSGMRRVFVTVMLAFILIAAVKLNILGYFVSK